MTLGELRDWVRTFLQESSASFWTDTELNRSINDAIKRVAKIAPSDLLGELMGYSLLVTAGVDGQFNLPSNFLVYKNATMDSIFCTRVQIEEVAMLTKNDFYEGTTASPKCWIWQNDIFFKPTTGTSHYIYYVEIPTELTADDDENQLNSVLDKAVVLLATSDAFTKDDIDQSSKYFQLFLETMKEVRGE